MPVGVNEVLSWHMDVLSCQHKYWQSKWFLSAENSMQVNAYKSLQSQGTGN